MTRALEVLDAEVAKISDSVAAIDADVKKIKESVEGIKFDEVKKLDFNSIRESLRDRPEYMNLWKAQKVEYDKSKWLRDEGEKDSEIKELITQKRLDVLVSSTDLDLLEARKGDLKQALKDFDKDENGRYARLLANLAYAYVLMAVHYSTAREHVTAVIAEKSAGEILLQVSVGVLRATVEAAVQAALQAGLAAATQGVSLAVMPTVLSMVGVAKDKISEIKAYSAEELVKQQGEGVVKGIVTDGSTKALTGITGAGVQIVDFFAKGRIAKMLSFESPTNETMDPYAFFIKKEQQLRRAAAYIASLQKPEDKKAIKAELDREMTLGELQKDPNWKFFTEVQDNSKKLDEIWEQVSAALAVTMRRLCWRLFCRSQWANPTYDYTVKVVPWSIFKNMRHVQDGPASEWNYEVWIPTHEGLADKLHLMSFMPRHWEKICSDFRGPEHDPGNPFTPDKEKARRLFDAKAWMSMAAVQCCQIRRPGANWLEQGWDIDLEKLSHFGGQEGEEKCEVPWGWSDRILVYGDMKKVQGLEDFVRRIRVKGGVKVRISEIRFGRGGRNLTKWMTKATGKKGRLESANKPDKPISIDLDTKITVLIERTDSLGKPTTSTVEAKVYVYQAQVDKDGKPIKHEGGKVCPLKGRKQLCWYCLHTPPEEKGNKAFEDLIRLVEVDEGTNQGFLKDKKSLGPLSFLTDEKNFVSFPHSRKGIVFAPGLYCIRLDPRKDWQTAKVMNPQYHISDEWWFRVFPEIEVGEIPKSPTEVKFERGGTEIQGKHAGRKPKGSAKPETKLTKIQVSVNGTKYHSPVINVEEGKEVDWKISVLPLRGGEEIIATAIWTAAGNKQSDADTRKYFVKPDAPIIDVTRPLQAGDTSVKGTSTAAEGVRIRIFIDGKIDPAHVTKLEGPRTEDSQDPKDPKKKLTDGTITWEVRGLQLVEGQKVQAEVCSADWRRPFRKSKSQEVKVGKPNPPGVNVNPPATELKPGDTSISGTSDAAMGLQVNVEIEGGTTFWSADLEGPRDDKTKMLTWQVGKTGTPLPPLKPKAKVTAQLFFLRDHEPVWLSEKSKGITVAQLAPPQVKESTLWPKSISPGTPIEGTATVPETLSKDSEIWVKLGDDWIAADDVGTPDSDGNVTWKLTNPPLVKGGENVHAQVFGKVIVKGIEQVAYSPLSAAVPVRKLSKPKINEPKILESSITGTSDADVGLHICVEIDGECKYSDALVGPLNNNLISWQVDSIPALKPNQVISAYVVFEKDKKWESCSEKAVVTVPKLPKPEVDAIVPGALSIAGTAIVHEKLMSDYEIWITYGTTSSKANECNPGQADPSGAVKVIWKLTSGLKAKSKGIFAHDATLKAGMEVTAVVCWKDKKKPDKSRWNFSDISEKVTVT